MEAMGGVGGHPPNFFYFTFIIEYLYIYIYICTPDGRWYADAGIYI